MTTRTPIHFALCAGLWVICAAPTLAQTLPTDKLFNPQDKVGQIEPVVRFNGAAPVGVAVSKGGRIFVTFPRTIDQGPYCVAEIRNGRSIPYPNARMNSLHQPNAIDALISVQGITADAQDRIWLLDTGKIKDGPVSPGGAKLICMGLGDDQVIQEILFPKEVAGPNAYLNDVRIDLKHGALGYAFITDSSEQGPNGIVVVDLATGKSFRRLDNHPSTKYETNFVPTVEGKPLLKRPPLGNSYRDKTGSDGIALGADGKTLYYCPNEGRHLYSVSIDALINRNMTDAQVAATVQDLGAKPGATDGMEGDATNNIYVTDYEHDAIRRRAPDGTYTIIARDARMIWPDSLAFSSDGYLYFTANQLDRQKKYHGGKDLRQKPYMLFRIKTDSKPQ